ncbi:HD-GYP domain-containing protein [Pelomonas sp. KK5]|uniref:HD-GYP domain-containing protein n=1 Tax=Pelomonas sp. KK5 TaxID=1855730 RepID=UPI00097C38D0|nr:HD domain-containing phosphohydrolase [Pelomonas sp. KK5]
MSKVSDRRIVLLDPHGETGGVNPHYLHHLLSAGERYDVRAGADITSESGARLLAARTRLDEDVREVLRHSRPSRPLENSVVIADGIGGAQLQQLAAQLIDEYPLLLALDAVDADESLPEVIGRLRLSPPLQALLTVYAEQPGERLRHAVGVALLTLSMARKLLPGKAMLQRQLALAALVHDVGELFIEPVFHDRERELDATVFRQIASHPLIGSRVLAAMEGAGPLVADAVLSHHERLDGFGYPRGIADEQFTLPQQLLAKAEWLAGLIEAGTGPLMRATISAKLIPGEFSQPVSLLVYMATRGSREMAEFLDSVETEQQLARKAAMVVTLLRRFLGLRALVDGVLAKAGPELRAVMERGLQRLQRIHAVFGSAGLDHSMSPEQLIAGIKARPDPDERQELLNLVDEFGWRMREIERTFRLRGSLMAPGDAALMQAFVAQLKGDLA